MFIVSVENSCAAYFSEIIKIIVFRI